MVEAGEHCRLNGGCPRPGFCSRMREDRTMKINETLHVENRDEWRAWLQKNHAGKKEIWLLFFKGRPARKQVSYGAAVEEALCFGWIDSNIQKIDDEKYGRKFTPRKKGSNWSALNKRRVAALIELQQILF